MVTQHVQHDKQGVVLANASRRHRVRKLLGKLLQFRLGGLRFQFCLRFRHGWFLVKTSSVDLIVTSPCYAQQRSVGISVAEYERWFVLRADQFKRVLKPTGSFILNIKEHCEAGGAYKGQRSRYVLDVLYLLMEHGWLWIDTFCWHKTTTLAGFCKNKLKCGWEPLYHFAKQTDIAFYHEQVLKPASKASIEHAKQFKNSGEPGCITETANGSGFSLNTDREAYIKRRNGVEMAYPDNVIECAPEVRKLGHDSPFPEVLPAFFIDLLTQRGDTVLDPFAGSGTTSKVAKDKERNSIAIDMNPENITLIQNRLKAQEKKPHTGSEE
jgi:site-specific DNA-methyltransferase (adenine-specific)